MDNVIKNAEGVDYYNTYYKCYVASYVKTTGLPMFGGSELSKLDYEKYADKWLSKTRCEKIKKPVKDGEAIVAWYRVKNGYIPLYDRSEE